MTNIFRSGTPNEDLKKDVLLIVLPALIKLLNPPNPNSLTQPVQSFTSQEKAPMIFSYLIAEDKDLQKAAMEGDAISKLANIIKMTKTDDDDNNYVNYIPTNSSLHNERLREVGIIYIIIYWILFIYINSYIIIIICIEYLYKMNLLLIYLYIY